MGKTRVLELLPFFVLIAVVAMLSTATLASASLAQKEYAFPNLYNKWAFGGNACQPVATTTVTNAYMPVGDVASSGLSAPSTSFSLSGEMSVIPMMEKKILTMDGPQKILRRQISFSPISPIAHL